MEKAVEMQKKKKIFALKKGCRCKKREVIADVDGPIARMHRCDK